MSVMQEDKREEQMRGGAITLESLEGTINKALKKINGRKENDICKYLPFNGGYMHHFTLRKMKAEQPKKLSELIDSYIIGNPSPKKVPHKPRKPRGSRKRPELITLTRDELDRLLSTLRQAGDHEIAARFSLKKSLNAIKKALIQSIRQHKVDHELWNAFSEALKAQVDDSTKALGAPARPPASAMVQIVSQP